MTLRLERDGAVARLLIDRPAKRNAMTQAMWEALPPLLAEAEADAGARVLIVAGAGEGAFSAGADIGEFATGARDPAWRARNQAAIRAAQYALARFALPTIAMISGDCIGGGCGLAIACDLRVAGPAARFGITPAKLGLVYPLHDTKLLVDLVGPAHAKRMLFTGELFDAGVAERMGLVDILVEDAVAATAELADTIAQASPHSTRQIKRVARRILDGQADDDAETTGWFDAAFDGPDFAEGVDAFLNRRRARFP
ncbi:MAG: enoyl-CoA hydratase [Alphaproteobacteria bacterium HGW-Alphaproteobacteria-16]|nr:MAG: enoyl-CoA hydratase [Alphaproteobacteria bacterium HGW-Alphaproteobacteria-16]